MPEAKAYISYKMPCFKQGKNIVYFAGYKNHIGFYPMAKPIEKFKALLGTYTFAKGSVQFPLNEPQRLELIKTLVTYRLETMNTPKEREL